MKHLEILRELRKSKGLTQLDMSEKIGMAKNNYGKLENGHIELTVKRLYEIAEILEVDILTLLGEKSENTDSKKIVELEAENIQLKNKINQLETQVNSFSEALQFVIDLARKINLPKSSKEEEEVTPPKNDINPFKLNLNLEENLRGTLEKIAKERGEENS